MSCLNPSCQQQNISGTRVCTRCGTRLVLDNRYRVEKFIGEGAFGRTFKAIDEKKLNKPCVIKQFLPQQMGGGALAKATELFKQEAERLDHLGSHPQIPDLLAFFEQDGRLYLIQQFIDGQDLFKELDQNGKFTENQVRQLLTDLLPVLDFIHSHNIIHRDIKPDNIIRNQSGTLVLIDFGVSKILSGSILTKMGTIAGTQGYAPPEQMRTGMVYPASDLYSLGVTCVRLLTNCLPHEDGSDELFDPMNMAWVWRNKVNVSSELGQILDKLLQDKVGDRYQSATKVLEALNPPSGITQPTPTASSTSKQPIIKHKPPVNKPTPTVSSPPQQISMKCTTPVNIPLKTARMDYTLLRDLLAAQKWKEANEETANVMLKVTGEKRQGWIDSDSINKFPCDDLRTLDQLWLHYSNNHFGFSIQKAIWLELGGKKNYDPKKNLGSSLGWIMSNGCINHYKLIFSLEAPLGHLPAVVAEWRIYLWDDFSDEGDWERHYVLDSIVSRVSDCNI